MDLIMQLKNDLLKCPMFSGVTDDDLAYLAEVVKVKNCNRGDILFSEGDIASGFYVLADGKVKVYKLSADGKERILHIVHSGSSFAEAAIFGDGHYPAYAEPLQPSRLLFFPKKDFLDLLHSKSGIAINMIGGLSRFLRQFASQVEQLTFQDVPARLARYILDLAGDDVFAVTLPIPKGQLASNLGTVSETLSRTFRKLSDEGLVTVQGKEITILDRESLEDLSESTKER
jgi:CRP/FNR family transcriptional regulator